MYRCWLTSFISLFALISCFQGETFDDNGRRASLSGADGPPVVGPEEPDPLAPVGDESQDETPSDTAGAEIHCADLGYEDCRAFEACTWEGGDLGDCVAADEPGSGDCEGDCVTLDAHCCELRDGCALEGDELGCVPIDVHCEGDCPVLGADCCEVRDGCSLVEDGDALFCVVAGPGGDACTDDCIHLGPDCCHSREDCVIDGDACFPAGGGGDACTDDCIHLGPDCCASREDCVIDGDACFPVEGGGDACGGECAVQGEVCCRERLDCLFYNGSFCGSAEDPPCGELTYAWCQEMWVACVWDGGDLGRCAHRAECSGDCINLGADCCEVREDCRYYMNEFCASHLDPPCGELNQAWCNEVDGCAWYAEEMKCVDAA